MVKRSVRVVLAVALAALVSIVPAMADVEREMVIGVDFPGGDLERYELNMPDPGLCRQHCEDNGLCRAWTFVKPGVQGPRAVCWVKGNPGLPRRDENTISGLRPSSGGPPPGGASVENQMRLGVDFFGNDLQSFALPRGDPRLCQNACNANSACQAWTFSAPGTRAPEAVCWLKTAGSAANPVNDLISGGRTVAVTVGGLGGQFNPNVGATPTPSLWGVWASASGGQWSDPCAIQYAAAQVEGNRYDGDPGYVRVRTRATQQEADLDIDHFGRYHRDQPDNVVKFTPCEADLIEDDGGGLAGGGQGGAGSGGAGGYRDPLGSVWDESEGGWRGQWVRRGTTNTFDASWGGGQIQAVLTISISGNRVSVNRVNASDGNNCQYEGTLNRNYVSGTYRCTSGGGEWYATIR